MVTSHRAAFNPNQRIREHVEQMTGAFSRAICAGRLALLLVFCAAGVCGCFALRHKPQVGANLLEDKVTTLRIEQALHAHSGYAFPDVQVNTSGQTVSLSGLVNTPQQKEQAAEIARSVHRFSDLRNEIRVTGNTATHPGQSLSPTGR